MQDIMRPLFCYTGDGKMTLTFYKDAAGKYRWRIVADNGKIVGSSSQGFANRSLAIDNSELVKKALETCNNGG